MPASSAPSIAVVGGGLSGLVLARILQQHDIACTVFELDATGGARRQGGLLDLHVESGQLALREAGLYEQFRQLTRPQAVTGHMIAPRHGDNRRLRARPDLAGAR